MVGLSVGGASRRISAAQSWVDVTIVSLISISLMALILPFDPEEDPAARPVGEARLHLCEIDRHGADRLGLHQIFGEQVWCGEARFSTIGSRARDRASGASLRP